MVIITLLGNIYIHNLPIIKNIYNILLHNYPNMYINLYSYPIG
nr:MAG TPA: hypothetical protein [Caudoviricetes sp.]